MKAEGSFCFEKRKATKRKTAFVVKGESPKVAQANSANLSVGICVDDFG